MNISPARDPTILAISFKPLHASVVLCIFSQHARVKILEFTVATGECTILSCVKYGFVFGNQLSFLFSRAFFSHRDLNQHFMS